MINFVKGDATEPVGSGKKIIAHICNDAGAWGAGFVLAVSNRWLRPEICYHEWHRSGDNFTLGRIQLVSVERSIEVANMIGQHGVGWKSAVPPIRYGAVRECLQKLAVVADKAHASVHMPRIGCGLAGGKWSEIEPIVEETLCASCVPVFVYDLK